MKKNNKLIMILFGIYLIILTWIIVFKMQFNFADLPNIRSINLIPFGDSTIVNGKINLTEIFNNLLAFIPVGCYIGILFKEEKFYKKVLPVTSVSLVYEVLQFILHVGATDITDVIMNTLGGVIGIYILKFIYKFFGDKEIVNKILNILALICTILVCSLILILIVAN